ncbi:hypothetical protein [Streptomyces sp. NPDC058441]|uniref:hypothetical protein n=1 Tax=Streptomyces sp. NPDC058441 TaxID=3346502 RepID=UPI003656AF80
MKLSELIADAQLTLEEFGDVPVLVPDYGCGCCKSHVYEPGESSIEKGREAWKASEVVTVPVAFVVA